jgi:chemotaxis protein methyltransferase WspC
MNAIERSLRERIGFDGNVAGLASFERIVRRRMKALGATSLEGYAECLRSSPVEYGELIEAVVVRETWFFRDLEAFSSLARMVSEQWLPRHPASRLRILSVPCASGEEAYSIAMALLEAGVPGDRFTVDAVDLSRRAIASAARGAYGKHSFRARDLRFRDRYFRQEGDQFVVDSHVQGLVHFAQGNLLHPEFATAHPRYDFIFFRNLLIYFVPAAQKRALRKIEELLSPDGALFVGSAEMPLLLDWGFAPTGGPLSFACERRNGCPPRSSLASSATQHPRGEGASRSALGGVAPWRACSDLLQARRLADAGRLAEAEEICETHLRQCQVSAQAYYLLGLVREARGDPNATEFYRKALYLEPTHYETLLQLAVLARHSGDLENARNLQRRSQRLENDPNPSS